MTRSKWSAWFGCLVVLGMGVFASRAKAQELPPKTYMCKNVFYLPVKIEERVRTNLREVQLYGKDNPAKPWVLLERALPGQTYFTYRAQHDGEYWFTVVIVDKSGRTIPGDLRKEGPALIVVLDTQQPQVDVQPVAGAPGEGTCIRCIVKDANPDMTKTRVFYQTTDMVWRSLSPMPEQPDQFCIPPQAAFSGMVKVEACDLALNAVHREFNIPTSQPATAMQEPTPEPAAPVKNTVFNLPPEKAPAIKAMPMAVESVSTKAPAPFPVDQVSGPDLEAPTLKPIMSAPGFVPAEARMPQAVKNEMDMQLSPGPVAPSQRPSPVTKHLVNKTHIVLKYQIDNTGPSGVGKVEFWITRDKGMTWQKLCEDAKHQSPAEVDLPGDGLFGICMVVCNGRGFGASQPTAWDIPDWWIEVDTTKPTAEIKGLRTGTGKDCGSVFITWSAFDKNLAPDPIDLFYAMSPNGPWQVIAQNLKNDGQYCWHMPLNVSGDAYVRLVARDAAGNSAIVDCPQPVPFDDMSRPRGRLTGVSTLESAGIHTVEAHD